MKKLLVYLLLALASVPAAAQSTWSGATDSLWTTAGNWDVVPASSSALQVVFGPTASTFTPNADAPFTLNRLSILGAPPYLLSGSMLTFAGANALLAVSGAGHVVQNILRVNADLEITATDDVTLPGGTTGGGIIRITATGARVTIGGASTNLNGTALLGGTLRFGDGVSCPANVSSIQSNGNVEFAPLPTTTLNGDIGGPGTVRILSGELNVTGTLFNAGATTVDAGATLTGLIDNNALLTVNGTYSTIGSTVGSLAGSGNVNVNGGALIVGGDNTNTTFGGVLASNGALAKVGTGTLTLTGVSTLTGGTAIVAGRLLVNGTVPGLVVVGAGATLGGTGTVGSGGGIVQVNAGGTLAPGLSPGVLNTGNVVIAGILLQEIDGPALGAQYDNLNTTGTVDLTGAALTLAGVYVPLVGDSFTIVSNDGVDPVVGTFAGLAEGATIVFNGVTLRITYVGGTGNDVVLAVVAPAPAGVGGPPIPTLSEWMLAFLALLMLTLALRSRSFRNNQ